MASDRILEKVHSWYSVIRTKRVFNFVNTATVLIVCLLLVLYWRFSTISLNLMSIELKTSYYSNIVSRSFSNAKTNWCSKLSELMFLNIAWTRVERGLYSIRKLLTYKGNGTVCLSNPMKMTVYAGGGVGGRRKMRLNARKLVRDGT